MNNSKSWAEVTTRKYKKCVNDWPDLNKSHDIQLKQQVTDATTESTSDRLDNVTKDMERLSTQEVEQKKEEIDEKSRDEIRAQRQLRRKVKQKEREEKRLQEKIAEIREPKSEKVRIVDKTVMETYLRNQATASARNSHAKSKSHSAVKVDLMHLLDAKMVKPVDKAFIQSKETARPTFKTQCHKGKKREIEKKKYVTKLKRSILLSRELRQQTKTEVKGSESDEVKVSQSTDEPLIEGTTENRTNVIHTSNAAKVQFSRKFRPYCDNFATLELQSLTEALLRDIFRFQDRAYKKNEVKARSQRRYVVGFKESMRQLDIGKVKLLIIAPDLEESLENGGLSQLVNEMKTKCNKNEIPYVFSLKRRQLGYVLYRKVPVSCVGILNYQGSEENSQKLLQLLKEEKLRFQSTDEPIDKTN
ncbi:Selenocysteine insertion sequence-binding protein 2 [Pseudolycoriella hygida]|uniref:Selenocysteine insertion sequence-binding protein 2 n=1 Tax=Pseudolycoriella hygida TaxID=35572 RepID=A0A9Q0MSP4_9DIPT|nr:Selenocysteine insertion sequence-binding protein 2 [Pseudolycoriella hygida]